MEMLSFSIKKTKKISEEDKFGDEGDEAPKEVETRDSSAFNKACNDVISKTNEYY